MGEPRQVFQRREHGLDHPFAYPQHVAHLRVLVVLLRQRGVERLVVQQLSLAVGEHDQREPGPGRRRVVRLHRALVRQGAAPQHNLRQPVVERPHAVRRRKHREHLVGRQRVARPDDAEGTDGGIDVRLADRQRLRHIQLVVTVGQRRAHRVVHYEETRGNHQPTSSLVPASAGSCGGGGADQRSWAEPAGA